MDAIATSLTVAACVFTGGLIGINLHRFLPQAHQTKETQDVVRLGTGMLSVLASLVLGLLVATAKGSYDTTDNAIRGYAAELALLNETLRDYGASAKAPHDLLRSYTEKVLHDAWPKDDQLAPATAEASARLSNRTDSAPAICRVMSSCTAKMSLTPAS